MAYLPTQWLQNLAKMAPAPQWPWRHSLRTAIAITVPMAIGFATNNVASAMIVCLGAMLSSVSVQSDPYRLRFRRIFISAPIGMSGYLLGSLIGGHGAYTIAALVLTALFSGLISGYGAYFSAGAMQMLIMAIVASHFGHDGPIWMMPALFLAGAAFACVLLAVEAVLSPHKPERQILSNLLNSLAELANATTDSQMDAAKLEAIRRKVTDAQVSTYSALMGKPSHSDGASENGDYVASILAVTDQISAFLIGGSRDKKVLNECASQLSAMAKALDSNQQAPALSDIDRNNRLLRNIARLFELLWPDNKQLPSGRVAKQSWSLRNLPSIETIKDRLTLGHEVITSAFRLALCMLLALLAEQVVPGNHSYWIPLSVAVIMKPDFGSVFARAALRSAGTFIGVLLATAIIILVPKGVLLVLVIAILGFILPWAGLRSYALQCAFLTPIVLVLIDFEMAKPTIDYGIQRLSDTLIGSLIALVFGYLIWPKSIQFATRQGFADVLTTLATYLRSAFQNAGRDPEAPARMLEETAALRSSAYKQLSNMRTRLQRSLPEPPPTSTEALAWLPAIAGAEALCDRITQLINLSEEVAASPSNEVIEQLATAIEQLAATGDTSPAMAKLLSQNSLEKIDENLQSALRETADGIQHLADLCAVTNQEHAAEPVLQPA